MLTLSVAEAQESQRSDEGSHVLALDNSWNRALEAKDIKALGLLLADTCSCLPTIYQTCRYSCPQL
jgi:ketosteroid isomerase-like protein